MIEKPFFQTNLNTEITYLKGVGPNRGNKLKKYGSKSKHLSKTLEYILNRNK